MAVYRDDANDRVAEQRSGAGRFVLVVIVLAVVIVGVLFATGFWSAKVTDSGQMPSVAVKASGGMMPKIDLDLKEVVIGTRKTTVDVPVVKTKKEAVDVPVVGVKP